MIGESIAHYHITAKLGEGGMGEVYHATDTKLHRDVAIKVLPESFAKDAERMARFTREAQVLAALNHPNIAQIYGVEDRAIVMELVEGETLKGPVPIETALNYAKQIAEALEAAHEKGIIHRDLKPANIKVTSQGVVKVLDFGLAAVAQPAADHAGDPSASPTMTISPTRVGMILGTAAYMSPEQARGKVVDKRADLWAFGVVLYEMLTGRELFAGETVSDILAGVLKSDPDWTALPPETPASIRRLLRRCLERDRKRRLHDIADARIEIEEAVTQPEPQAMPNGGGRIRLAWVAAGLLLGAAGGWQLSRVPKLPDDNPVVRFQIQPPDGGRFISPGAAGGGLAFSPDGRTVAFVAVVNGSAGLWVRSLIATQARLLPGTGGATFPFWSPDSKLVAFSSFGTLQAFDLLHGTSSKICDVSGVFMGGTWSSDGRIVYAIRDVGMFQVSASGGTPSQFVTLDRVHGEITHGVPQMLPQGWFLYEVGNNQPDNSAVYAAPLRDPSRRVRVLSLGGREALNGVWYLHRDDGKDYIFWIRGSTLVGQPFDSERLQLTGEAVSLADPAVAVSSASKVLVYAASFALRQFQWIDRAGKVTGTLGEPGNFVFCRISPDGRRVITINAGVAAEIWLLETARGVSSRLTSRGIHIRPVWSPDGRTILFGGGTPFNVFRISADGSGGEERVLKSETPQVPLDWSTDGRLILYNAEAPDTGRDLWTLEVTPDGRPQPGAKPRPYIREPFNQSLARFSPNMGWVAYQSDESGRAEVYLRSFPEPREKIRISTVGGRNPEWAPDGRKLFYISFDDRLMEVALKLGPGSAEPSLPRALFQLPGGLTGLDPFDVAQDGQRFLVPAMADKVEPLTVIVNWPALLKK
jgi:Tol biopolymer transport system component/predicted Ser/Thr protein kinase